MHPSSTVSYDLARARIADLRHQARRDGLARAAARSTRACRAASTSTGPSAGTGPPPPPADPAAG